MVSAASGAGDDSTSGTHSEVVVVEAELFSSQLNTTSHRWVPLSKTGASAGGAMVATPDKGSLARTKSG